MAGGVGNLEDEGCVDQRTDGLRGREGLLKLKVRRDLLGGDLSGLFGDRGAVDRRSDVTLAAPRQEQRAAERRERGDDP